MFQGWLWLLRQYVLMTHFLCSVEITDSLVKGCNISSVMSLGMLRLLEDEYLSPNFLMFFSFES